VADPWEYFPAEALAAATECPLENVRTNWPRIVEQLDLCGINQPLVQIGMAGTIAKESASTFLPVREAFYLGEPAAEHHRKTLAYYPFYGRGYIQITHRGNYERYGRKVAALWRADPARPDFNLVGNPDRALDPTISAAVSALFFRDTKTLQGYGLVDACMARDWDWVRRLVLGGADPDGTARITRIAAALGGALMPTPLGFNPDAPVTPQPDSWSCAVRAAQWILRSIGRNPGDAWITTHLLDDGVVTREHGLMDASGTGLAAWLTKEYGTEMAFTAASAPLVTFDDVRAGAGTNPTLMGGRRWNHWSGVRGYDAARDLLLLANPGDGWMGVYQTMSRAEFSALGDFSAVYIDRASMLAPTPPAPEPPIVVPPKDTRMERARALLQQALDVINEPTPV
jgi:predicted chitinase